jgi:hypothetical protein
MAQYLQMPSHTNALCGNVSLANIESIGVFVETVLF